MGLHKELATVCGENAVHPESTRYRVTPRSTQQVAGVLEVAGIYDAPVVIQGAGTKSHWGPPAGDARILLDLSQLTGFTTGQTPRTTDPASSGSAADFLRKIDDDDEDDGEAIGVLAGTPLATLQRELRTLGRRVCLDIPLQCATVGGTIATDTTGPLRLRYDLRDLVIGLTAVLADGMVLSTGPDGGSGWPDLNDQDPGDLLVGSYGTLAVITEAWLRVEPEPPQRVWITRTVRNPGEVREATGKILNSGIDPAALEVNCPYAASSPPDRLVVLLEGDHDQVAREAEQVQDLLGGDAQITGPPDWWGRYPFGPGDAALEITTPLGGLFPIATALNDVAGDLPLRVRCSPGIPLMRIGVPPTVGVTRFERLLCALYESTIGREGTFQVLYAPPEWQSVIPPKLLLADSHELRKAKERLDPWWRLTPGRLLPGPVTLP